MAMFPYALPFLNILPIRHWMRACNVFIVTIINFWQGNQVIEKCETGQIIGFV